MAASNPKLRPQSRRLPATAQSVERARLHAGGGLGPGVVWAKKFFMASERGLGERECSASVAGGQQQPREAAARNIRVRMIGEPSAFFQIASARS